MKDNLLDLIQHTNALGFIDLIKVNGTDKETSINAIADDRTVIVSGKFKNVNSEFEGTFGMPNLAKLKTILGFNDYDTTATINMTRQDRDGEQVPTTIHFETADKSFVNDYRLMSKAVVEEKIKPVKFAGASWNVSFAPKVANIQRLKKQAQANNEELNFSVKQDGNNIKIHFGEPSTHSGNFIFENDVTGSLARTWSWPVKQFLALMDLPGDKMVHISDQGVLRVTVDSGIADYEYLLPAQQR
jgi:hypothetical protein